MLVIDRMCVDSSQLVVTVKLLSKLCASCEGNRKSKYLKDGEPAFSQDLAPRVGLPVSTACVGLPVNTATQPSRPHGGREWRLAFLPRLRLQHGNGL